MQDRARRPGARQQRPSTRERVAPLRAEVEGARQVPLPAPALRSPRGRRRPRVRRGPPSPWDAPREGSGTRSSHGPWRRGVRARSLRPGARGGPDDPASGRDGDRSPGEEPEPGPDAHTLDDRRRRLGPGHAQVLGDEARGSACRRPAEVEARPLRPSLHEQHRRRPRPSAPPQPPLRAPSPRKRPIRGPSADVASTARISAGSGRPPHRRGLQRKRRDVGARQPLRGHERCARSRAPAPSGRSIAPPPPRPPRHGGQREATSVPGRAFLCRRRPWRSEPRRRCAPGSSATGPSITNGASGADRPRASSGKPEAPAPTTRATELRRAPPVVR